MADTEKGAAPAPAKNPRKPRTPRTTKTARQIAPKKDEPRVIKITRIDY